MFDNLFNEPTFQEMEQQFTGHSLRAQSIKGYAWVVPAVMAAGSAVSALAASSGGGGSDTGGVSTHKPKILPKTESGTTQETQEVIYDQAALSAMSELADSIGEFADYNENFIREKYQPLQEQMLQANSSMIPQMESIAGESLEQMSRDLVSNRTLSDLLQERVKGDADPNSLTNRLMKSYTAELDNLPTEDERVGQALAQVESQFQGAGKQLVKDFASRGQSVSQASKRELLMKKATAKAGAATSAAEGARKERLSAMERGLATSLQKRAGEEQVSQAATQGLLGLQQMQQGALGAKAGLFDVDKVDPTSIRGQEMALVGQQGILQRGTTAKGEQISHLQKGLASAQEQTEEGLMIDRRKQHIFESGDVIWDSEKDQLRHMKKKEGIKGTLHDPDEIEHAKTAGLSWIEKQKKKLLKEAQRGFTSGSGDSGFQGGNDGAGRGPGGGSGGTGDRGGAAGGRGGDSGGDGPGPGGPI
jgi:hypothetical protein